MSFFWQLLLLLLFLLFRATPAAYGGSQARGGIGASAAALRHSHVGSEPHLRPTPQLMAMWDSYPTEQGQGSNLQPHGSSLDTFPPCHDGNSYICILNFGVIAGTYK